jgi:gamma-glutamyl:cysteine ligase YbdK (ATP-grasp superfamily)
LTVLRLIKHTVEAIRTKLDRIYLEALHSSKDTTNGQEDSQEVHDLQEELESLYSEILPVAQMSTEQQFLEPALREITARDGQGQERSVKAVKYVQNPLLFQDLPELNLCRSTTVLASL